MAIHPSAVVESSLPDDVQVGALAVIEAGVEIGPGSIIHAHATLATGVRVGSRCCVYQGAVLGKRPAQSATLSRSIAEVDACVIGDSVVIGCHAVVYAGSVIGDGTLIGDGANIREECRIGASTIIGRYVTLNYSCIIGDRVKIMDHTWLAGNMCIEDDVFISGGVMTANDNRIGRHGYDAERVVGPTVKHGAAVGVGAILLPGVQIGPDSIVAAGAVVSRDVAAGVRVKGIPAREG